MTSDEFAEALMEMRACIAIVDSIVADGADVTGLDLAFYVGRRYHALANAIEAATGVDARFI